jgi:uncharacterized protein (TIGR03086 family)
MNERVPSPSVERYLRACSGFTRSVSAGDGHWHRPSPCTGWDARDVVEHVIGFHDVLILRPLGAKPERPPDDPVRRWSVTDEALRDVLTRRELSDGVIDVPAIGSLPASQLDLGRLLPVLTQDVLVHTWDLAKAVGADDRLDAELCARYARRLPEDPAALARSGLFEPAVPAPPAADAQARLLAGLGRDPGWAG